MNELENKIFDAMNKINSTLGKIEGKISSIEDKLENDYHELHGNGQPGLIHKVNELQTKVSNLETELKAKQNYSLWIVNAIAWFATFALGIFNLLSK